MYDLREHEWTILVLLYSTRLKIVDLNDEDRDDGSVIGGFLHSLGCDESHGLEKLRVLTARYTYVDLITKFHMLNDVELWFSRGTTKAQLVEAFSKLSALNRLSRLRVNWGIGHDHHPLVSALLPPRSVNFQSLHSIGIVAPPYMALVLVQCLTVNTTLKRIRVCCTSSLLQQTTTSRQIVDECGSVAPSLEEVDFKFYGDKLIGQETFDAVLDLSRRLRPRTLKFTWSGLGFDDAYIQKGCLSRCFSHLEVLHIKTFSASHFPTLQVLRSLAIHCPLLKDLNLPFTAEVEHLPLLIKEIKNELPLSHCLKSLVIFLKHGPQTTKFLAHGEAVPIVSEYLASLFPSLEHSYVEGSAKDLALFEKGIRRTLKTL